jgi:hypothetical protein
LVIDYALLDVGEPALAGEAEMLHELLTDDDVADAERARARNRLESYGLDPDEVCDDFISYRTVDRHFEDCTDRERGLSSEPLTADEALDRVHALKRRLERVTGKSITQVAKHTDLGTDGKSLDVFVDINVTCSECGDRTTLTDLFEEGCSCGESTPDTALVGSLKDGEFTTRPGSDMISDPDSEGRSADVNPVEQEAEDYR